MEVNMIVAAGKDGAIGINGDLIWYISSDLKRFKSLTMGHPVIMGRKTWESLPKKPLPGRLNIVMTGNPDYCAPGAVLAASPMEALELAEENSPFIMGGQQVYKVFMPYVTKIYLTEIDAECPDADARMHFPLDPEVWDVEQSSEQQLTPGGLAYRFVTYGRKKDLKS